MAGYDEMMDLSGRFGDLNVDQLGEYLQQTVAELIQAEFDGKFGPDGEVWPPNKTTPWYFDPNNHLRDSVAVGYGNHEIIVSSDHVAFGYQIYGTYGGKRIQPHPLLPGDSRGLGPIWGPALDETYGIYFEQVLGGYNQGRSPGRTRKR